MQLKRTSIAVALAGAVAAFPAFAGGGSQGAQQSGAQQSSAQQSSAQQPASGQAGLVIITLTPVESERMQRQQREAMFRQLDADGDGAISLAEAGVNTQLLNAFAQVDQDGNARIERQELAAVRMQDGSSSSQASAQSAQSGQSAASGGSSSQQQERSSSSRQQSQGSAGKQ